jgi:hypothetical protein
MCEEKSRPLLGGRGQDAEHMLSISSAKAVTLIYAGAFSLLQIAAAYNPFGAFVHTY